MAKIWKYTRSGYRLVCLRIIYVRVAHFSLVFFFVVIPIYLFHLIVYALLIRWKISGTAPFSFPDPFFSVPNFQIG